MTGEMTGDDAKGGTHPIEEVRLVVPETDDPSVLALTFRSCFLGLALCSVLIFLNTFFTFRTQPLTISGILMQIAALPAGRFMAWALPDRDVGLVPGSDRFRFRLNPGPFTMKEHVIVTVFANCGVSYGGGDAYSIGAITIMKAFYKQSLGFGCALLIVLTTQMLGYGWAGMLRRYLVEPADMWWPSNLAQVSLFRALHEKDNPTKGPTRMKFFIICFLASFFYYALPGYLFTVLTFFSWVCMVWPHSVTAHQIGSGYHGLGLGAFTFDWAGIAAYHGSPLVTPWVTILNTAVGFVIFAYIVFPLSYWKFNIFGAHKFPLFSNKLFTADGKTFDVTKILTPQFELNEAAYQKYGKLYLNPMFALSVVGSGFARMMAVFSHVILFHGRDIWQLTWSALGSSKEDVHTKLMKKYKEVPHWWFLIILGVSIALSILISFVWKNEVQLPWWGMIFGFGMAFAVTLPIGIIQATTNQQPGYDIIAQYIIGMILPGKPIANLLFKIYGHISTGNALSFLADLKLGHYMKIPPRSMFAAQLLGTLFSGTINLAVAWWMLGNIENICDTEVLPENSPWTCPKFRVTFDASVIWGLIGPAKLFKSGEMYHNLVYLFLVGLFLPVPVWVMTKVFPEKKWIRLINVPVIAYGFAGMPPASPSNIASWIITGTVFNFFMFRYRQRWWQRYNYVLSAALDAGTALMGVLLFLVLQNQGWNVNWWGTELDHCPLATCPTEPGLVVKGCPVF